MSVSPTMHVCPVCGEGCDCGALVVVVREQATIQCRLCAACQRREAQPDRAATRAPLCALEDVPEALRERLAAASLTDVWLYRLVTQLRIEPGGRALEVVLHTVFAMSDALKGASAELVKMLENAPPRPVVIDDGRRGPIVTEDRKR